MVKQPNTCQDGQIFQQELNLFCVNTSYFNGRIPKQQDLEFFLNYHNKMWQKVWTTRLYNITQVLWHATKLRWTHKQQQNSPWILHPYLGSAVLNLKGSLQSSAVLVTSARKNNSAIFSSTTVENFKNRINVIINQGKKQNIKCLQTALQN